MVWPLPRSLATTDGISVDVFSSPYLDVSVRAVPPAYLWIQYAVTGLQPAGFPHSDTHGSLLAFSFPWLFADRCVLHRLPVPRHPPCALSSLTFVQIFAASGENYALDNCRADLRPRFCPTGKNSVNCLAHLHHMQLLFAVAPIMLESYSRVLNTYKACSHLVCAKCFCLGATSIPMAHPVSP